MRTTPLPEFQSEVLLPDLAFDLVLAQLQNRASAIGTDLHNGHGRSVWVQDDRGEYGAKKLGTGSLLFARAHRPEWLAGVQAEIADLALSSGGARPDWNTDGDRRMPVNFSSAKIISVTRLSPGFIRLRLAGAGLARLGQDDSIHFRLVQPPSGSTAAIWPHVGERGQTVWPGGDMTLRRPVYTTRRIDPQAGWLETDLFLHPGGRTTAWALAVRPGDPVGLMGPSGGGVPQGRRLIFAGDETAYPALARFLETLAGSARGQVWLLGRTADYPLPETGGFTILHRPGGESQLAAMLENDPARVTDSLWVAGERSMIEPLRLLSAEKILPSGLSTHVSAFWTA